MREPPVGRPPHKPIYPSWWPSMVHRWPVVGYHWLSVPSRTKWSFARRTETSYRNLFKKYHLAGLEISHLYSLVMASGF